MTWANSRSTWIGVAAAAVALTVVIAVVAGFWNELGDTGLSAGGWIAMALGILATLALGIGLMSLVFISSRRGYDETGGDHR
jgi:hypothetical protein